MLVKILFGNLNISLPVDFDETGFNELKVLFKNLKEKPTQSIL